MGERGRIKQYGKPIQIQFTKSTETQLRIFAEMDGVTINALVRKLVAEGLRRRVPSKTPLGKKVQQLVSIADDIERMSRSQKPSQVRNRDNRLIRTELSPKLQAVVDEYKKSTEE